SCTQSAEICQNNPNTLQDDDQNGLADCADPGCTNTNACTPGNTATGAACANHSDCEAPNGEPACLDTPFGLGFTFPGGYCSGFCDPQANDCAAGAVCVTLLGTNTALCLDSCDPQANDCRNGYNCRPTGFGAGAPSACLPF